MQRVDGRSPQSIRTVEVLPGWQRRAEGSVLYRAGGTVVLCTASVDDRVKDFLRGQNRGWITAEYLMHPRAGERRQSRDGFNGRPLGGRSHEIARLIGRALRASVDLTALGERTISIDCDVLEADGGTRTASITAGMIALSIALDGLRRAGTLTAKPLRTLVSAVSAGLVGNVPMLDLCYTEDSAAGMDLNLVADESGHVIELQCTAEAEPVPRKTVDALTDLAIDGTRALLDIQRNALAKHGVDLSLLRA